MTQHITQEQVCTLWIESTSRTTDSFALYTELCNAAIQHYIDQQAKELPVLPDPTWIYHNDKDDETQCDLYEFESSGAVDVSNIYANGRCDKCVRLYTSDQLQTYGAACAAHAREVALSEAMRGCKDLYKDYVFTVEAAGHIGMAVRGCADAIEALKKAGK